MENKKKSLWQFFQMLGKTFMFPIALLSVCLSRGATVCVGLLQQGESGVDGLLAGKQRAAVTETSLMLHYAPELVHMGI